MKIEDKALEIIKMGSPIAGALTGTALSFLTDNQVSLLAASGVGAQLPIIINDFAERFLSKREKVKIGALEAFTIYKIKQNLDQQKLVNPKFTGLENSSLSITELYEGVLIKAKNEFEEKKIEHLAYVFGNSLFDERVSPSDANHILNLASNLSYRKLCMISFFNRKREFLDIRLPPNPFLSYENAQFYLETMIISQDMFELREQCILSAAKNNNLLASDKTHLTPAEMQLSPIGSLYYNMLE